MGAKSIAQHSFIAESSPYTGTVGAPSFLSHPLPDPPVEITYNRYIHFFEGDLVDTLRQAAGA